MNIFTLESSAGLFHVGSQAMFREGSDLDHTTIITGGNQILHERREIPIQDSSTVDIEDRGRGTEALNAIQRVDDDGTTTTSCGKGQESVVGLDEVTITFLNEMK